jgi:hypothetical protein
MEKIVGAEETPAAVDPTVRVGQWVQVHLRKEDGTTTNAEILAVHAALLHTGNVLYFSGSQHDPRNPDDDATRLWIPIKNFGGIVKRLHSPAHDLFCCGHAFLEDGRLLVAGGTSTYPPPSIPFDHAHDHYHGIRDASIFNPIATETAGANPWSSVAAMHTEPSSRTMPRSYLPRGGGRWYPTLLTQPDGTVFTMAGHPLGDDRRPNPAMNTSILHTNDMIEIFDPLPAPLGRWIDIGDQPNATDFYSYPRLHLLSDGHVFCVQMGAENNESMKYNFQLKTWSNVAHFPSDQGEAYNNFAIFEMSSVLLPLIPEDSYRARLLVVGAVTPQLLDFGEDPFPHWIGSNRESAWPDRQPPRRKHCNTVLLPDGSVLVIGGIDAEFSPGGDEIDKMSGVNHAELYSAPYLGLNQPGSIALNPEWIRLAPSEIVRGYHSVALLLPDGSVWVAGSNENGDYSWDDVGPRETPIPNLVETFPSNSERRKLQIEMYRPPYLSDVFRDQHPIIERPWPPDSIQPNTTFNLSIPNADDIHSVALIRCGSVTHGFNFDQRYVRLLIKSRSPTGLTVISPPDNNIAPPGYYLLFVISRNNIPSEGKFILMDKSPELKNIVMPEEFPMVDPLKDPRLVKFKPDTTSKDESTNPL